MAFIHVMPFVSVLALHCANGSENDTISFLRARQLKWGITWTCHAIGTGVSVTWCWWHLQWHHCIYYISMTYLVMCCHWNWNKKCMMLMALSRATLHFLGQNNSNEVQHDFHSNVMLLTPVTALHYVDSIINGTNAFSRSR